MIYLTLLLACLGICRAVRDLTGPDDPDYTCFIAGCYTYPEYLD